MRRFLIKCAAYGIPVILLHLWVARYADGFIDPYYLRFTSEEQSHLIIGSSKAAQGLRPEYLDAGLGLEPGTFFNYAFTLKHSPYGSIYRESIAKKLAPDTKDGIFILEVDSWSISGKHADPEDESLWKESEGELGKTEFVNMDPNYEYLIDNYDYGWLKLAWKKWKPSPSVHELHENGWLEIDLSMDSIALKKRVTRKVKEYKKNPEMYAPSQKRKSELVKTIKMLKQHGRVYLVRMPISGVIAEIEDSYMPEFGLMMDSLAKTNGVDYFDMRPLSEDFDYVDGNHVYRDSGDEVSKWVARFIVEHP